VRAFGAVKHVVSGGFDLAGLWCAAATALEEPVPSMPVSSRRSVDKLVEAAPRAAILVIGGHRGIFSLSPESRTGQRVCHVRVGIRKNNSNRAIRAIREGCAGYGYHDGWR